MFGLYLHTPFCLRRCAYCDFYSQTDNRLMPRYVDALCKEISLRQDETDKQLASIYWGGGTPSQLPIELVNQLFAHIQQTFDLSRCKEITFEANPDDLTPHYIAALRSTPINRLSIGIQSFNNTELKLLARRHTAEQAAAAVERCFTAGFEQISVDLIYGLPNQSPELWRESLQHALALPINHLSAYHLSYEEGTDLYQKRNKGEVEEVDQELSAQLFMLLRQETELKGMEQYEISNFCLPGCHALHNSSYWKGTPYLGVGASAHSYDGERRGITTPRLIEYMESIEGGRLPVERELLTQTDRYNEYIITRLRTKWGVRLSELTEQFGSHQAAYCMDQAQPFIERNLLSFVQGKLTLTPQGILLSNSIMADLMWV